MARARVKPADQRIREALDDIVPFALKLPDTVEAMSYGMPAIKRGKRWVFGLRKDNVTLSMRCSFEERARLMTAHPDIFFITDHYLNYPAVVVNLANATKPILRAAIVHAWECGDAPLTKRTVPAAPKAATPKTKTAGSPRSRLRSR